MPHRDDDLTQSWLRAEREAVAAELELASYGQAQATPEFAAKATRAGDLRRQADALFDQLHARVKDSGKAA